MERYVTNYLVMKKADGEILAAFSDRQYCKDSIEITVSKLPEVEKEAFRRSLLIIPIAVLNQPEHL